MGAIEIILAFGVVHIVDIVADVQPAALVHPALCLAQPVDAVPVMQLKGKLPGVLAGQLFGDAKAADRTVCLQIGVDDRRREPGDGNIVPFLEDSSFRLPDDDSFGVDDRCAKTVFGNHGNHPFCFDQQSA